MFDPFPWPEIANEPRELRGEALSTCVQAAAEELGRNLDRAAELTQQWTNGSLADALVDGALTRCLTRLAATGCVGEANRLPSSRLWNLLGERLQHGWLIQRARMKPRGYAGDYELLEWIFRERVCEHPWGRSLDRYFQNQAAPLAVRARTDLVATAIVGRCYDRPGEAFHIVSVGAGPAADLRLAVSTIEPELRQDLHFTLLDLDPAALEFATEKLAALLPGENIAVRQINPVRLPQRPAALPEADLLVCSGLFDYLNDDEAAAMLQLFWSRLRRGGLLLVGNFSPDHPTRPFMEWFGNWYLVYRTPDDLHRLAERAAIPVGRYRVISERVGVDRFLVAEK